MSLPHLVFILADDLGWNMTGYSGRGPQVSSPFLDSLVPTEALQLNRHYAWAVCGPSRASLLTGRVPPRAGYYGLRHSNNLGAYYGAPTAMTLLPEKLQAEGYRTGFAGKWDAGFVYSERLPCRRGFDKCLGFFPPAVDHFRQGLGGTDAADTCKIGDDDPHFFSLWGTNGPENDLRGSLGYGDVLFVEFAVDFIESQLDESPPLFLYLALQVAHAPWQVPDAYVDLIASRLQALGDGDLGASDQDDSGQFRAELAMVTIIDEAVENVTAALRRRGMWDDTLLIFSSDNGGPHHMYLDNETRDSRFEENNYPLNGYKGTHWDGGFRVTAFVSGGMLPVAMRGRSTDALIAIADWYATLCGLAGGTSCTTDESATADGLPDVDSIDQWPVLSGATAQSVRTTLFVDADLLYDLDDEGQLWKLYQNASEADTCSMQGIHYSCSNAIGGVFLFELTSDPSETNNLADLYPDRVESMQLQLANEPFMEKVQYKNAVGYLPDEDMVPWCAKASVVSGGNLSPVDWYIPLADLVQQKGIKDNAMLETALELMEGNAEPESDGTNSGAVGVLLVALSVLTGCLAATRSRPWRSRRFVRMDPDQEMSAAN